MIYAVKFLKNMFVKSYHFCKYLHMAKLCVDEIFHQMRVTAQTRQVKKTLFGGNFVLVLSKINFLF